MLVQAIQFRRSTNIKRDYSQYVFQIHASNNPVNVHGSTSNQAHQTLQIRYHLIPENYPREKILNANWVFSPLETDIG